MKVLMLVLTTASLAAVPAAVGAQAQQQAMPQSIPADPNEIVCEKQEVTGSRLAHRKVCMTRSQWQDARRQDRQAIEKVQTNRGMNSSPTKPGG